MNGFHRRYCRSDRWARTVSERLLPWALRGVDLGPDVLELGPGPGVTTRLLADRVPRLTAVEIDPDLARRLAAEFGGRVRVVRGDATALDLPGASYSGVVCFTMLHHVPSPALQDRLFGEAYRMLRPGGVFAGSDSRLSLRFRLVHLGDTMVPVDPHTLASRLTAAGFADVAVTTVKGALRFSARRP